MTPPLISYVTFNRLGLTVKNLSAILDSKEDFEIRIVDNGSTDGTWQYIQGLSDHRIKSKLQNGINTGKTYALNLNLVQRKPDQYFITVDNDVYIETKDWIDCFMRVFKAFPSVGLLGVQRGEPYSDSIPPVIPRERDKISYLELDKKSPFSEQNYIPGCCQCLSPSLLKEIGFWNEENGFGDVDLTLRVKQYTRYNAGFVTDINIEMPQVLECEKCQYQKQCELIQNDETKNEETCFTIYQKLYKNDVFKKKYYWRFVETKKDMESGARPVYCASALDAASMEEHIFNLDWALDNHRFYIENAN